MTRVQTLALSDITGTRCLRTYNDFSEKPTSEENLETSLVNDDFKGKLKSLAMNLYALPLM